MNYHKIAYDDQLNGEGLRVVLFLSGCNHYCKGCQNPQTWDPNSGKPFDEEAKTIMYEYLDKPYMSGITFSGGDPLYPGIIDDVKDLIVEIKNKYKDSKDIWLYTGFTFEECLTDQKKMDILSMVDVLVEGPFIESLKDNNYNWAGSTNQRVIDLNFYRTLCKYYEDPRLIEIQNCFL